MDMSLVIVYENNDQKIEMIKPVADWLWFKRATRYKLTPAECETISNEAAHIAFSFTSNKKKTVRPIITTLEIPVFSKDVPLLNLSEPYDIFEEAILLIGDAFGFATKPLTQEWRHDLAVLVTTYYELQGLGSCLCSFFSEPICKVDGFLWYYNEDNESRGPICLPFILNDGKFKKLYE